MPVERGQKTKMSEENISLIELLNLAIGTPQAGVVNFRALQVLLHAVLRLLDIREMKTPWRDTPPGDGHSDALVCVTVPKQDHTEEEQHQADGQWSLRSRIQTDEDGQLSLQSHIQTDEDGQLSLQSHIQTDEDGQLSLQSHIQTDEDGQSKAMKLIQELNNQNNNLTEELKELRNQQKVEAEMVSNIDKCCRRVDALEEAVKSVRDTFQKHSDREELSQCVTWDIMQSVLLSKGEDLQKELVSSGVIDSATAVKAMYTPFNSNFPTVDTAPSHGSTPSSPHPVDNTIRPAAPTISGQLPTDAQTAIETLSVLSEPTQQTKTGLTTASTPLTQKARGSDPYQETVEALRDIGKLQERFSKLETCVASQLTHLRELVTDKGSCDVSNNLMDQLNQQRALIDSLMSDRTKLDSLEDMFMNLTSSESEVTFEAASGSKELRQPMSDLRISVQKLEEDVKQLKDKQALTVNVELVSDVQKVILQLQAECEKLHETTKYLHDDNRQKQSHIEELYKMTEELQEKKADKQMVESELKKADKSDKVSCLQFDSAIEQLYAMFHEVLNKVTGQEQDWHKVIDRISTEMECKLNRIELDCVKKQLEGRWKNIHQKLQALEVPEHDGAAAIRKQLVDRFHCLSCDRPVVMHNPGQHLVKLPSTSGFPPHKSIKPKQIAKMTDSSHLSVLRSCGGSHTVISASQQRTGLQHMKHYTQTDVAGVIQSEVDIIGQDGHIYKGRLYTPAIRNTENKLPTISTKDGMCKTKDKVKHSVSHKPAASPEVHHPHSAKSPQCSRSASSSSGRDWPVSALGCTSQSSITLASAAAESNTEPHTDETLNL